MNGVTTVYNTDPSRVHGTFRSGFSHMIAPLGKLVCSDELADWILKKDMEVAENEMLLEAEKTGMPAASRVEGFLTTDEGRYNEALAKHGKAVKPVEKPVLREVKLEPTREDELEKRISNLEKMVSDIAIAVRVLTSNKKAEKCRTA